MTDRPVGIDDALEQLAKDLSILATLGRLRIHVDELEERIKEDDARHHAPTARVIHPRAVGLELGILRVVAHEVEVDLLVDAHVVGLRQFDGIGSTHSSSRHGRRPPRLQRVQDERIPP